MLIDWGWFNGGWGGFEQTTNTQTRTPRSSGTWRRATLWGDLASALHDFELSWACGHQNKIVTQSRRDPGERCFFFDSVLFLTSTQVKQNHHDVKLRDLRKLFGDAIAAQAGFRLTLELREIESNYGMFSLELERANVKQRLDDVLKEVNFRSELFYVHGLMDFTRIWMQKWLLRRHKIDSWARTDGKFAS